MFDLTSKIALVTGAASGIGEAVAKTLAAAGAFVYVGDLDAENGERVASEIVSANGHALFVRLNVADEDDCKAAAELVHSEKGRLDILVNNAGVGAQGSVEADDGWDRVWAVNVMGTVHTTRAALPWLRRSSRACIVNTGSIAGWRGLPNRAAYSASKGAVHALTMAMKPQVSRLEAT